jgi:H+-translocating NAD(P) transhydrogenase subunit beta
MNMIPSLLYIISGIFFILSLKNLSSPKTARNGNILGILGMVIAVLTTSMLPNVHDILWIIIAVAIGGGIGTYIALKIKMTEMPQLVAAFHSLVGMSAVLVASAALLAPESFGINVTIKGLPVSNMVEMALGSAIGAITFSGSIVAFLKLQGIVSGSPIRFRGQHLLNALILLLIILCGYYFIQTESKLLFFAITIMSFILGFLLIIPIGGADMPVVVSMLNSYSGWAASGIGFTLENSLLIITGALVGSSGAILSYVMCKAMNRSIFNVIFGGFSTESAKNISSAGQSDKVARVGSAEDAAFLMKNAKSVIIVPGYGMAVAQAQHVLKEMTDLLKKEGVEVKFAIHPVAGRMPGHMNVLLAEANVSYEDVYELEDINREFSTTDVAFVIGANDVTNPAAKTDQQSPIYGMPILEVANAKNIFFIKRGMSSGYAGVENELFFIQNTQMLFGDAKKVTEEIVKAMEE